MNNCVVPFSGYVQSILTLPTPSEFIKNMLYTVITYFCCDELNVILQYLSNINKNTFANICEYIYFKLIIENC